ncbi:C-C motif chemokine 3-like [Sorex araneus]|uniref:C-C motif chemokine 3-like n=1 Tax=Sorex araneus TaxID=42254 RepID=UPI00033185D6|nr:C-C motif chemokine 3-like [Sorex araneus]
MQAPGAAQIILLCTMVALLCSQVLAAPYGADTPTACCFSYASRPVQRKFIVSYFETSSQCSKPGIIFQTKKGRQICANPSEAWVQDLINALEQSSSQPGVTAMSK